jgi:cellulose synthase/poly-beta-1,6-N-acetylglucosamine synthase-like glycosyltransferase
MPGSGSSPNQPDECRFDTFRHRCGRRFHRCAGAQRSGERRAAGCGNRCAVDGRWAYEIIYVNDGSTDATAGRLADLMKQHRQLRQLKHDHSSGQSAAVRSGVRAARGAIVATLDGDGQNNPAFLPDLIPAVESGGGHGRGRPAGRAQGHRFQAAVAHCQRRAQ